MDTVEPGSASPVDSGPLTPVETGPAAPATGQAVDPTAAEPPPAGHEPAPLPDPEPVPPRGPDPAPPADVGPVPPADAGPVPPAAAEPDDLVELVLASVELSDEGLRPAIGTVTLLDMAGGGRLDIVMARADAVLVQEAIAGTVPPRPRTHELLLAAVDALAGAVTGVTLVERRPGGVYVANLRVRRPDGSTVDLDARPSDALNIALRSTGAVLRATRSLVDVPAN